MPEPDAATDTTDVPLSASQIRFLLDMMMGCPLGHTEQYSYHHNVNAGRLYDHLQNCLPDAPRDAE